MIQHLLFNTIYTLFCHVIKKDFMRIIIAGAGEVGTHLAKMLSNENHEIILIDTEEDRLKPIDASLDVLTYVGSATSINILQEVLQKKTDLFIAVTHWRGYKYHLFNTCQKAGCNKNYCTHRQP